MMGLFSKLLGKNKEKEIKESKEVIEEKTENTESPKVVVMNGEKSKAVFLNEKAEYTEEENKVFAEMTNKILTSPKIYCPFSKFSGSPYLYSEIETRGNQFRCTPPRARIYFEKTASLEVQYPKDLYEIVEINSGDDKRGICNFIGNTVHLDGAVFLEFPEFETFVPGNVIVPNPDFSKLPLEQRPVLNPDVQRWLLLMGQNGVPEDEMAQRRYSTFAFMLERMITKADFVLPFLIPKNNENTDSNEKPNKIELGMVKGHTKNAVMMFTDARRMSAFLKDPKTWGAVRMKVRDVLGKFDVALNTDNSHPTISYYIDDDFKFPELAEENSKSEDK